MKTKLHAFVLLIFISFNSLAQSVLPPTVSVQLLVEDWCNGSTGLLDAQVFGGTPPYTYQWSMGANTQIANGLSAGFYDVTVTDNLGVTAYGSGIVNSLSDPQFFAISIEMAAQGKNNGSVTVAIYPDNGGIAQQLPDGIYYYDLLDSSGALIENYSYTIPGPFDPYYYFDSLPAGSYSVQCSISGLSCYTYNNFNLKEMPPITPTFNSLPSCNGAPTGQVVVNMHPSPTINANTFTSNQSSNLGVYEIVTSKYKAIVYDSLNAVKAYFRTQDSIFTLNGLMPGNYTMKIYAGDTVETFYPGSHDSTLYYTGNFSIANDTLCSLVSGRAFVDYNSNCVYGTGDVVLSGTLVELNPGNFSAVTNSSGQFYIPVPVGVYTLKQYAPYQYAQLCPDTNTFSINVSTTGLIIDVQLADSINVNPDVQLGMYASQPRPGFNQNITITYKNNTPNLIQPQTITLNYDTGLAYINSSPTFATNTIGQLTWLTAALGPFQQVTFHATVNVPSTTLIGTALTTTSNVTAVIGESNVANNWESLSQTVTGSFDPNDITVDPVGFDTDGYITNIENLKYTIRFQNTGNDTAFTVVVSDTLPLELNKYSLQVLTASHPFWYEFKTPNVVLFHFDNILLPDSIVNEVASHGFIKFSISQIPNNLAGTMIKNTASIYFDFNAPVITNTVSNTIFDCNQMASVSYSNQTICEGDSITASADLLFDMNTEWWLDGNYYSSDSMVTFSGLTNGIYQVDMIASNSVCDQQISTMLTVNALPAKPTITINSDTLISSSATGNQWLLNAVVIAGATASTYYPVSFGWHQVMVTDLNGCSNFSDSVYAIIGGIKNNTNQYNFKIIPNPANDMVQLNFDTYKLVNAITITDVLGKEILSKQINTTIKNAIIDINSINSGLYFINVKTPTEVLKSRFVKQ